MKFELIISLLMVFISVAACISIVNEKVDRNAMITQQLNYIQSCYDHGGC